MNAAEHATSRALLNLAIDSGWAVKWHPQEDTGGHPFVNVEGVRGDQWFLVTWHTRATGTFRIFNASTVSRARPRPSTLAQVREYITTESLP